MALLAAAVLQAVDICAAEAVHAAPRFLRACV